MRDSDCNDRPWLETFIGHPAVGGILGWPDSLLLVFQRPLCSLPVLAVAMALNVGELWLHDRWVRRVAPVAGGPRCLAALVWPKPPALLQGGEVHGHVIAVMVTLPSGSYDESAEARLALDPMQLEPVVDARS